MDYTLNTGEHTGKDKDGNKDGESSLGLAWASLGPLLKAEKLNISIALVAVLISSAANLLSPVIIARVIDTALATHNFGLVLRYSALLLVVYLIGLVAQYIQTIRMGTVGRGVLFSLRNELFTKLSSLPIAFFNQNKAGDLISRVNNDTDKLNQFFSQALMQFFGNFFIIVGAGVLLVVLHVRLGLAALLPALGILIITQLSGAWVKRKSRAGLQSLGSMSGEIQESLANFKVIVAFNRLDYFREKFREANEINYKASVGAGIASNIFTPIYTFASNIAQLIVLGYGIVLISHGQLTIGLLVGYLLYVTNFYNPLRQLASVWSSLQLALASLDRIGEVLELESNLHALPAEQAKTITTTGLLTFEDVSFAYPNGKQVLGDVNLTLEAGKTYALVGPTGGGKTTTASLMARLYDPTKGTVYLEGRDIRTYTDTERAQKIGFILQEPFLFSGTVRDNIVYGNTELMALTEVELLRRLSAAHFDRLMERFTDGLETVTSASGDTLSLGQKQLVAFMRAVLRAPDLLILDEATANIDTVTEQLLEDILEQLPKTTTKVIIAHRLNTISSADDIFFINGGHITEAGSMDHAVEMLMHGKRSS
ncbi:MAG: multidrug transporter [Parcubacteria group bacterium]|nr:multidrug transporter [Parcubacteria group bacterium]